MDARSASLNASMFPTPACSVGQSITPKGAPGSRVGNRRHRQTRTGGAVRVRESDWLRRGGGGGAGSVPHRGTLGERPPDEGRGARPPPRGDRGGGGGGRRARLAATGC